MTASTAALRVDGLTVHYGEVLALDDISISLGVGSICGLIGMNGSGKSTLFKSIMGLVTPDAGSITIAGQGARGARRAGLLGYVPQGEDVDWNFPVSVRDVVMMGRYGRMGFSRRPSRVDRAAVDDALQRVDLADLADRQIGQLSGGQRKRAFVARGIAQEARMLLLDEPFAGVDARSEATISRLLREIAGEGRSILIATHDLRTLPELADDAVLLRTRVLQQGPPSDVLAPARLAAAFGLEPTQEDDR